MVVRELPKHKGYTVDERLREFRKMEYGKEPEFIQFDSEKGKKMLKEMQNPNPKNLNVFYCKRGKEDEDGGILVSSEEIKDALEECTKQWTKENWPERAEEMIEEFSPKKLDITKPGLIYNDEGK